MQKQLSTLWPFPFRHQFKAHPVNKKIFNNPNMGVRKIPKKEPTQPVAMRLETERRVPARPNSSQEDSMDQYEFHAKPVPTNILKHPVVSVSRNTCCLFSKFLRKNALSAMTSFYNWWKVLRWTLQGVNWIAWSWPLLRETGVEGSQ